MNLRQIVEYVGEKIMVMKSIYCVLMRGGTSKGVFFKREDLPEEGPKRVRVLMKVLEVGTRHKSTDSGGQQISRASQLDEPPED